MCDTCYEVTARRGLRNNPSKINISKPHLCVWLNVQSQFPLLSFYARPMPNLTKIAFTQKPKVCVCIHTVTYLKLHNCFGKLLIFLHRAVIRLSTHIWHTLTHSPPDASSGSRTLKSKRDDGRWKFQKAIKTNNLVHFNYVGGGHFGLRGNACHDLQRLHCRRVCWHFLRIQLHLPAVTGVMWQTLNDIIQCNNNLTTMPRDVSPAFCLSCRLPLGNLKSKTYSGSFPLLCIKRVSIEWGC